MNSNPHSPLERYHEALFNYTGAMKPAEFTERWFLSQLNICDIKTKPNTVLISGTPEQALDAIEHLSSLKGCTMHTLATTPLTAVFISNDNTIVLYVCISGGQTLAVFGDSDTVGDVLKRSY